VVVGVDPVKVSILYMTTDNGNGKPEKFTRVEYSSRQRRFETLQTKHKKQLEELKKKHPEIAKSEKKSLREQLMDLSSWGTISR